MHNTFRFVVGLAALVIPSAALAIDTTYDTIDEMKAFGTGTGNVILKMETLTNTCRGSSSPEFHIQLDDPEIIRLGEMAWLSGKTVSFEYVCKANFPTTGTTSARIVGIRAR